jgi:F-type H+-transporting ATPase subunit b
MNKPLLWILLLGTALVPAVAAQESAGKKEPGFAEEHELALKWANFALLVGALGYLIKKNAGPFYAARSHKIREQMVLAEEAREDAERRASEVDRRLASLEADIASLRAESRKEAENEIERMRQQTVADIAKIRAQAEHEIAAAGKTARSELKRYSAELALDLAKQKLRARLTPQTQEALVRGFVRDLDSPPSKAQAN